MVKLARMRQLIKQIPPMVFQLNRAEANATTITTTLTGMPRGTDNHSKVEDGAILISALREAYTEAFDELNEMQDELEPLIDSLDDADCIAAMRLRYVMRYKPEEVAGDQYRDVRTVYRYLRRAEEQLIRMYPDRVVQ